MSSIRRTLAVSLLAFGLAGCAGNPYVEHYVDLSDRVNSKALVAPTKAVQVQRSTANPNDEIAKRYEAGYVLVGTATFDGSGKQPDGAEQQAAQVGASEVVIYRKLLSKEKELTTVPVPVYSSTSGMVTSSSGRSYNVLSNTQRTTTGVQTYTRSEYEYTAQFYAPEKVTFPGLLVSETTPALRQELASNAGALVRSVRRGSAAFKADLLPGDVILTVGGARVDEAKAAFDLMQGKQTVHVTVWRKGVTLEKTLVRPAS